MLADDITALILTLNEEDNIARVLDKLEWVGDIVIVDSGSTDHTAAIAANHPKTRMVVRPFDNHAAQWNHGLHETGIATGWVLALDADYVLSEAIVAEIRALQPPSAVAGYRTRFRYCVLGRVLARSMYPPVITLYRRDRARYVQDGHTQRVVIDGEIRDLVGFIEHDDRKPFARWLAAQDRYATLECEHLRGASWSSLAWRDRLRRMIVIAPWLVPLYCMTLGLGFLNGRAGLHYALQRGLAETLLALKLIETALARATPSTGIGEDPRAR